MTPIGTISYTAGAPGGCILLDLNPNAEVGDQFTMARFSQVDGQAARILLAGFGGHNTLTLFRANGTAASMLPLNDGDSLGGVNAIGMGTSTYKQGHGASDLGMGFEATENWTDTAHGCRLSFNTTPNTTNGSIERLGIENDGSLTVAHGTIKIADQSGILYSGGVQVATRPAVSMPLALAATAVLCFGMGLAWSSMAGGMAGSAGRLVASALR